jgi:hypothetical protein
MTTAMTQPAGVRCSDADRERTSERLRIAAGDGCLTMDELSDRLAGVYAARYTHYLAALVADLPGDTARARTAAGWRAVSAMVLAQLGADLSLLFGRGGAGWTRRRTVIAVLVALAAIVFIGGVALSAVHGAGGDGFPQRGFDGPPRGFGGRGRGF